MIWATDHTGSATYFGPEWPRFTGQAIPDALGDGWMAMLHPEDIEHVRRSAEEACRNAGTLTLQYRLQRADGSYARVVAGAAPSHSPIDGTFVGYLGSTTEVSEIAKDLGKPQRRLLLPPPSRSTMPLTDLDMACDYVLLARGVAERAGEATLMASLDVSLSLLFLRLGGGSRRAH